MEVIELLKTSEMSDDDIQYITDYEAHKKGVENYNQMIIAEERFEANRQLRRKDEEIKRKDEEIKRKDEEINRRDEEIKRKNEEIFIHLIENFLKKGFSINEIADLMEMDIETLQSYIKMIPKK